MASSDDRTEIIRVLRVYHAAMVDARTDDLKRSSTRTSLMGAHHRVCPAEGRVVDVVRSAQFDYQSIRVESKRSR